MLGRVAGATARAARLSSLLPDSTHTWLTFSYPAELAMELPCRSRAGDS